METTRGILFRLSAVMFFVAMFAMIKATSDIVPAGQAVFYRSAFALPVIIGWMVIRSEIGIGLKVKSRSGHFWRSIFGTVALSLNFAALGYLPLPEVTAIGYAAPLLTVIFAAFILGERLRIFQISAVLPGLLGVLVIVEPRLTVFYDVSADKRAAVGSCLVLSAAVFGAFAQIQIRRLVQNKHPAAIAFDSAVTSTCLSLLTLPFGWMTLNSSQVFLLIASGVMGGLGQICLTLSYRYAPASVVAPFEYASIIFAILIGYFIFSEVVSSQMLIGVSIVICAGIIIIWREAQLGIERSKANALKPPLH